MGRTTVREFWRGKYHFSRKSTSKGVVTCLMNGVVITEAHYDEALRNPSWDVVLPPVAPQTAADLEWAQRNRMKL